MEKSLQFRSLTDWSQISLLTIWSKKLMPLSFFALSLLSVMQIKLQEHGMCNLIHPLFITLGNPSGLQVTSGQPINNLKFPLEDTQASYPRFSAEDFEPPPTSILRTWIPGILTQILEVQRSLRLLYWAVLTDLGILAHPEPKQQHPTSLSLIVNLPTWCGCTPF